MTPQAIKQLQAQLGVPATGVFDTATSSAYSAAVARAVSTNPALGTNDPTAVLNAYTTGDWSGVTSLTGKPFTDEQQQAAVTQAETALAPAYKAQESNDRAITEESLNKTREGLTDTVAADARQFGADKNTLDQNAADQGVLFSGSRVQKQNDLRTTYQERDAIARRNAAESIGSTARGYQYAYGNEAAQGLASKYALPGAATYNANVAGGAVTPGRTLASAYDPGKYNFQGTAPVAQKTAVQTRAAGLLANRANKLTLSGVGAKF